MGGGQLKIPLKEIKKARFLNGKSIMPANMASDLSDHDFLDLLSYLRTLK